MSGIKADHTPFSLTLSKLTATSSVWLQDTPTDAWHQGGPNYNLASSPHPFEESKGQKRESPQPTATLPAEILALLEVLSLSELIEIMKWMTDVCNGVMTIAEFSRKVFHLIGQKTAATIGTDYGAVIGASIGTFLLGNPYWGAVVSGYLGGKAATVVWDKPMEVMYHILDNLMAYMRSL